MNCLICGTETSALYDPQFKITYYKCPTCDFIHQDPDAYVSFEQARQVYDLHENTLDNEGYVHYFIDFFEKGVMPYKQSGDLLDFGSGPEPVLTQIINRDYDFKTTIYDLHFHPDSAYKEKTYDVIVSTEVFEHLEDPVQVFEHLVSLLKPGGILSIMTLLHHKDDAHFLDWWYRRDETHISFFTEKTLSHMAKELGLEMIYCDQKRIVTFQKTAEKETS